MLGAGQVLVYQGQSLGLQMRRLLAKIGSELADVLRSLRGLLRREILERLLISAVGGDPDIAPQLVVVVIEGKRVRAAGHRGEE